MKDIISKAILSICIGLGTSAGLTAQTYTWINSTEGNTWQTSQVKLQTQARETPIISIEGTEQGTDFRAWGTCFNELGWDALNILTPDEREDILRKLFAPDGDLRFTMGRFSMNANDYARSWYSCDEVPGDFRLKYFNIERDKQTLIPYIRSAQRYNPNLTFWISPWCPPSWMKINGDYPVRSSKYNQLPPEADIALYEDKREETQGVFPKQLAVNDYMIQDPRYLQTYANYFCKFIDAYREQGIPITMVMYQNEAYSYTPYPGCAWTAEGIIRFNAEYLAPTLKKHHPEVALYLGTFNTNRLDHVEELLANQRLRESIQGIGFQWEGGQILPKIRAKYPQYKYVQTESECGWGSFDWKAGEHTFSLMNHYLGNGCEEYTFWNCILCDNGESPWGWKQNALIRVDSKAGTATFTPEYYAVKHYSSFVVPGSKVLAFVPAKEKNTPVLVAKTPQGKYVIIAGNFSEETQSITLKLGNKYLNAELMSHSFHTFIMK
ncbi:MAG: beta-glycosidase [Bacteroides sp.]|nr:beta-glycosidase [Bacteroides sp.]